MSHEVSGRQLPSVQPFVQEFGGFEMAFTAKTLRSAVEIVTRGAVFGEELVPVDRERDQVVKGPSEKANQDHVLVSESLFTDVDEFAGGQDRHGREASSDDGRTRYEIS
jgi:hypothetical protein